MVTMRLRTTQAQTKQLDELMLLPAGKLCCHELQCTMPHTQRALYLWSYHLLCHKDLALLQVKSIL